MRHSITNNIINVVRPNANLSSTYICRRRESEEERKKKKEETLMSLSFAKGVRLVREREERERGRGERRGKREKELM